MKYIIIASCILTLTACKFDSPSDSYSEEKLSQPLVQQESKDISTTSIPKKFELPNSDTNLSDTINLSQLSLSDQIDIDSLVASKYSLINFDSLSQYAIDYYAQAEPKIIRNIKEEKSSLLIMSYYTSMAGDGNPMIKFIAISNEGQITDSYEERIHYQHGYELIPEQTLITVSATHFELNLNNVHNKLENDSLIVIKNEKFVDVFKVVNGKIIKNKS